MRCVSKTLVFAATAAAMSSVTVINPFEDASTLSIVGSDSTATTYVNYCAASTGASRSTLAPPATFSDQFSTTLPSSSDTLAGPATFTDQFSATLTFTPLTFTPTLTTAMPRLRRQDDVSDDSCDDFTIVQGASTWKFHKGNTTQVLPVPEISCSWTGASTTADLTCIGSVVESSTHLTTTTWQASDREPTDYMTVAVITGTTSSSASSRAASTTAATKSAKTGLAAPMPFPTGAMALAGGAAGLLAAAVAL